MQLLSVMKGAMHREKLQSALHLKARKNSRKLYLAPALDAGLIKMTIPDMPRSSKQQYRLTEAGWQVLRTAGQGYSANKLRGEN